MEINKALGTALLVGTMMICSPTQNFQAVNYTKVAEQAYSRDQFSSYIQSVNPRVYDRLAQEISDSVIASSKKYSLSPIMVLAIARVESEFNVNATSIKNARGLMQINPINWYGEMVKRGVFKNPSDIHDPVKNIEAGCFVFRTNLDATKDFEKALNLYLGGDSSSYRSAVNKAMGDILMHGLRKDSDHFYKERK